MQPLWYPKVVQVTPTLDTDAYTAGDVLGGLLTFNVENAESGRAQGYISKVEVIDSDNEGAALKLYLYGEQPTEIADDAAWAGSQTAADLVKLLGDPVAISSYDSIAGAVNLKREQVEVSPELEFNAADGNLYGYLVCDATPTYAAADKLTIKLHCWLR